MTFVKGSEFVIRLPAPGDTTQKRSADVQPMEHWRGAPILVVDDNADGPGADRGCPARAAARSTRHGPKVAPTGRDAEVSRIWRVWSSWALPISVKLRPVA